MSLIAAQRGCGPRVPAAWALNRGRAGRRAHSRPETQPVGEAADPTWHKRNEVRDVADLFWRNRQRNDASIRCAGDRVLPRTALVSETRPRGLDRGIKLRNVREGYLS